MLSTSRTLLLVAMVVLIAWTARAWADETAEFRAGPLTLAISPQATARCRVEREGKPALVGPGTPFCSAVVGGKTLTSIRMRPASRGLYFEFPGSPVVARIVIESKDDEHLQIEVADVRGEPEELRFVNVRASGTTDVAAERFLVIDDMRLGLIVDSPTVRLRSARGAGGRLMATAYRELPGVDPNTAMIGRRAALFACQAGQMPERIAQIEQAYGIPVGFAAKTHPGNRRSYLLVRDIDWRSADRVIDYAVRGGFGALLLVQGSWSSLGHRYCVARQSFPSGIDQLRGVVQKAQRAGLLVGAHVYATVVPKTGQYTSPDVHPGLYRDLAVRLARAADKTATQLETTAPPTDWPTADRRRDLVVDNEIITYAEVAATSPIGFAGCKRGRYNTKAALHSPGAVLSHLVSSSWGAFFVIDHASDLLDMLAEDIARTYNAAGFDWVYFDGAEAVPPPGWYTVPHGMIALLERMERTPVIVQAAARAPFTWHWITRTGQRDYFRLFDDPKREIDDAIARSVPRARQNRVAADIGWFPLNVKGAKGRPGFATIDEVEYLYTKALASNAAVSVHTRVSDLDALPHRDCVLDLMSTLERLRIEHYFPSRTLRHVLAPNADFMLVHQDGRYHLLRARRSQQLADAADVIRGYVTEPLDGKATVSLWNVGQPVELTVDDPSDLLDAITWDGRQVPVTRISQDRIRLAVETRVYLRVRSDAGREEGVIRNPVVSPLGS